MTTRLRRFRRAAREEADRLEEPVREAAALARKLGLEPYPVNYWVVDHDEMNQLIAYGGFQTRYPHWRWGMTYDRQQKQDQFGMGKAFEIVNNDDPSHAFLQESNSLADQKAVITHVEAHADFFRNNEWFSRFSGDGDLDAAAMLERHAETIQRYIDDPEIDREDVERFVDAVTCLEDTIDQHRPLTADRDDERTRPEDLRERLEEMDFSSTVSGAVFDDEWLDELAEAEAAAADLDRPRTDVLGFLLEHGTVYDEESGEAVEMEPWQTEVLELLRREAYYFAPQKMTKTMNEGWACVVPDTLVFTSDGLTPMRKVVEERTPVSDGESVREVYDANIIEEHETVTVETRRGFELTGSNNHRIRRPDGSWIRLDELSVGDRIEISGGNDIWPETYRTVEWSPDEYVTLEDVAEEAGVSLWTVLRYRRLGRAERADEISAALEGYAPEEQGRSQRTPIRVPDRIDEKFGRFLGLLIGDGHVSSASKQVGFTSGEKAKAEEFAGLVDELFGVNVSVEKSGRRWRAYVYSADLVEFLDEGIDIPTGKAADSKTVPDTIRRSPKSVVVEFLRGLFDADGYAGEQGVILSTKSEEMSKVVQLLLMNFGILNRRRRQQDGCYHVHVTGKSARRYDETIGFGYPEKAERLRTYIDDHSWFRSEEWTTEVTGIEEGRETVYDISVTETHRYAAAGFVNHNSYWESQMMGEERFAGTDEFLTYADHQARVLGSPGLNPYKLGKELWEYVENTTNRREVAEKLLRVEGITWRNFHDAVDFEEVQSLLEPPEAIDSIRSDTLEDLAALPEGDPRVDWEALDRALSDPDAVDVERYPWKVLTYEGLAERHFSLLKPQNRSFLRRIRRSELEGISRYMFDDTRYRSVEEAIEDVEKTAGWDRMREVRESHNDVTFVDAFLSPEFVESNDYFTYEYTRSTGDFRVASTDPEDVKKKLLLQFTNFGKPTIAVFDDNFENRGELLLGHRYNGIMLDLDEARDVLERVHELWGRPVNLMTIRKEYDDHDVEIARRRNREPEPTEVGIRIRYDGEAFGEFELDSDLEERIAAADIDYDTKPEEWLS